MRNMKSNRTDGETKVVNGVTFYWSRRLRKWVTIPEKDEQ